MLENIFAGNIYPSRNRRNLQPAHSDAILSEIIPSESKRYLEIWLKACLTTAEKMPLDYPVDTNPCKIHVSPEKL